MSNFVSVVPTQFLTPQYVHRFSYSVSSFDLFSQITFVVFLYDANNKLLSTSNVTLSGECYKLWGDDDNYILNYISSKLGLTLMPPVTAPVVPVEESIVPAEEPTPDAPVEEPVAEEPVAEEPTVPVEEPAVPVEEPAAVVPAEEPVVPTEESI
jgi:hypothetical protein